MLFRCLDAVERLRDQGLDVGLLHKATLNVVDESALARVAKTRFALVVESQNEKTGLGARYGTWLLRRGMHPRYDHLGSTRLGSGGLWEQIAHQGLSVEAIVARVEKLAK